MARVALVFFLLVANPVCWAGETQEKLAEYEGLYTWAYPIVSNMKAIRGLMRGALPMFGAVKVNEFVHARRPMAPEDKFVSPNVDVLFSIAIMDLSRGPVALEVPDTKQRYYVLQFLDPWTNSFAYLGKRSTGTEPGSFLIVGPDDNLSSSALETFDGRKIVRSPYKLAVAVLRIAIANVDESSDLHEMQNGFVLIPPIKKTVREEAIVGPQSIGEYSFWEQLDWAISAYPPSKSELRFVNQAKSFSLGTQDFKESSKLTLQTLKLLEKQGQLWLEKQATGFNETQIDGWNSLIDIFNFNRDHFGRGVINSKNWIIENLNDAVERRAIAARIGLWGNHGYEAAFFQAFEDKNGARLEGKKSYQLVLQNPPPAKAFWSVTNYTVPDFFLYENAEQKYSISSYDRDLVFNDDGSITIIFSHERPGEARGNWLPTPKGFFRPLLSLYHPDLSKVRKFWPSSSREITF